MISGQGRRSAGVIGLGRLDGITQNLEVIVDQFHKPIFFLLVHRANESHVRRKDGRPGGKFPHLLEGWNHCGFKASFNPFGKLITHWGKINDGGGDPRRAGDNIGAEHRQIKARVWEEDTMKDLEPQPKPCDLQVQFAKPTAAMHLITDEQSLAIQRADDLLKIARQREWLELREPFSALTDASGHGHHQRMHLLTARGRRHQSDP